MKIDLSYMPVSKQNEIYNWFHEITGNHGSRKEWVYHHQPSKGKYWIDICSESLKTFWILKNQ